MSAYLVVVDGAGGCPTAEAVQARLAALVPDAGRADGAVRITRRDGVLELEIGAGPSVVRRRLPRIASCALETEVAATVIAAWDAELRGPVAAPTASTTPQTIAAPATMTTKTRRLDVQGEVALIGALAGSSFAAGATAEIRLAPVGWRLGFRVGVLGEATREIALGSGRSSWGRSAVTVGAGYRLGWRRLRFEARAQALVALVYVAGAGFAHSYIAFDGNLGLGAGVKLGVVAGPVQPFLGVDVVGWLKPEQAVAEVGAATVSADLPAFEVVLSAGLAFGHDGSGKKK